MALQTCIYIYIALRTYVPTNMNRPTVEMCNQTRA